MRMRTRIQMRMRVRECKYELAWNANGKLVTTVIKVSALVRIRMAISKRWSCEKYQIQTCREPTPHCQSQRSPRGPMYRQTAAFASPIVLDCNANANANCNTLCTSRNCERTALPNAMSVVLCVAFACFSRVCGITHYHHCHSFVHFVHVANDSPR